MATHSGADQGGRALERTGCVEGQQAQGHATPPSHVLELHGIPGHDTGEHVGGSHQAGQRLRLAQRAGALGVPMLELGAQGARSGCSEEFPTGAPADHQGDPEADPSRHALPVPYPPAPGAREGGTDRESHDGCGIEMPRSNGVVPAALNAAGQCVASGCGLAVPPGHHAAPSRHQTADGARVRLRTLVLSILSNYCCLNSAMRALLWAHTGPIASAQDVASDRGFTNAGSQAIDFLLKLQHRPLFLPGMLLWRFMLAGWARAQEQHDCAEFLYHIVPKPCPKALEGDWSARRQEHARPSKRRPARVSRQFPLRCLPGGLHAQGLIHQSNGTHSRQSMHSGTRHTF